jgi:glutathione peroxidase-family protein
MFVSIRFGLKSLESSFQDFVRKNYDVTFPLFDKVDVKGPNASPVWKFLTGKSRIPKHTNYSPIL